LGITFPSTSTPKLVGRFENPSETLGCVGNGCRRQICFCMNRTMAITVILETFDHSGLHTYTSNYHDCFEPSRFWQDYAVFSENTRALCTAARALRAIVTQVAYRIYSTQFSGEIGKGRFPVPQQSAAFVSHVFLLRLHSVGFGVFSSELRVHIIICIFLLRALFQRASLLRTFVESSLVCDVSHVTSCN